MSVVPVLIRAIAALAGEVSRPHVELFTQDAYFWFQVLQVFLIRTLTDTASTTIIEIAKSPATVFRILSQAIPISSNFYMSYFIMQGLAIATSIPAQVVQCALFHVLSRFRDSTPRMMHARYTSLEGIP